MNILNVNDFCEKRRLFLFLTSIFINKKLLLSFCKGKVIHGCNVAKCLRVFLVCFHDYPECHFKCTMSVSMEV